jgi:hypothetical protein
MSYDYTTPDVVAKIVEGQILDITPEQANEAIHQLAVALQTTRKERDSIAERFQRAMSDFEMRLAKARGQKPGQPAYKDGVRYESPTDRPLGPDGFPQRGIV